MARTARSGPQQRASSHGGRHDDRDLYQSRRASLVSCACVPDAWDSASCSLLAALAGGGFWLLSTFGKKVVTAPVESLVQPSWIKEAVAYAPEADAADQGGGAPPDRTAEIMRQLAAMQQEMQAQREASGGAQETSRARRHASARAKARCAASSCAEAAWLDAVRQSRPEGGRATVPRPVSTRWRPGQRSCPASSKRKSFRTSRASLPVASPPTSTTRRPGGTSSCRRAPPSSAMTRPTRSCTAAIAWIRCRSRWPCPMAAPSIWVARP